MVISPITLNSEVEEIYEIDLNKLKCGYKDLLGIDISNVVNRYQNAALYKCKLTGYKFFHPPILGDAAFYKRLEQEPWYYAENKWEHRIAINIIKDGNVLEVGCGHGYFIDKLADLNISVIGIDTNESAVMQCRKKGLDVKLANIEEFAKTQKGYNYKYIVLFQILEHIHDVDTFMQYLLELLVPGGMLLIAVPNNNSLVFDVKKNNLYNDKALLLNLPPHHSGKWTPESLKLFAKYYNLEVNDILYEPLYDARIELVKNNLIDKYLSLFKQSKLLNSLVRKFVLKRKNYINGDTIFVSLIKK